MWEPQRLTTLWASMACYRDSFTVTLPIRVDLSNPIKSNEIIEMLILAVILARYNLMTVKDSIVTVVNLKALVMIHITL
jgi:hypothetical protein